MTNRERINDGGLRLTLNSTVPLADLARLMASEIISALFGAAA